VRGNPCLLRYCQHSQCQRSNDWWRAPRPHS